MPSCYICGRTRNSGSKDLGISFHQIPKNEKYREQWLDFIRKCVSEEKTIKSRSVVCSEHFTADCFRKYNNTKLLKEFSVPSISVSRLKSAKINVPEVKFMPLKPVSTEITDPTIVVSRDLFSKAAILCDNDTPKKHFLKRTISTLVRENFNQRKKIKVLNQQIRRQRKNISSLKRTCDQSFRGKKNNQPGPSKPDRSKF
eukprot:XP_008190184.1 PREDICTED: THAP domain-containing protein 1-like [Acyrthosiphon pisum]